MSTENFFEKIWSEITSIFGKVVTLEHQIVAFANKLTDAIKNFQANPTVKTIEDLILSIAKAEFPQLVPLISGLELELPKILALISSGVTDLDAFVKWLEGVKANPIVFAGSLGTLSASITHYVASNNGIEVTPAQALTSGQVVHQIEA